jgi:hypothetical protein
MQAKVDPTTHEDRVRATAVMLELAEAEDKMVSDEVRLEAARAVLYAPAYDIDGDTQDALADRIAERLEKR